MARPCLRSNERCDRLAAKPLLGGRTSAILFRDFEDGGGYVAQPSTFYWKDGFYVRSGKAGEPVVKFTIEPLAGDDFVVERSQKDKADGQRPFAYLLGRKVAAGGYLGVPLADDALPNADWTRSATTRAGAFVLPRLQS